MPDEEMKLEIELVPSTTWKENVRSYVSEEEWDVIRRAVYRRAEFVCEVCGGKGEEHPVECHEVWEYDDINHVQRLKRMIALCPDCHMVKHMGLASSNGRLPDAVEHYAEVNDLSFLEAMEKIEKAFEKHGERSTHEWEVDMSILEGTAYKAFIKERLDEPYE